nr:MAG TPA: hypothetical protein [Caudoviricetes sp.]
MTARTLWRHFVSTVRKTYIEKTTTRTVDSSFGIHVLKPPFILLGCGNSL